MQIEVYITDDDPSFRTVMGDALQKEGRQFSLCKNSNELISALEKSHDPAIVFLDIFMDGEDGISTVKKLQDIGRRFRLRFVTGGDATTAVAANLIAKAHDLDVGRTLYKPFSLDQFLSAVADDTDLLND